MWTVPPPPAHDPGAPPPKELLAAEGTGAAPGRRAPGAQPRPGAGAAAGARRR